MNTTISSDNNEQTQIQNNRIGTAGLVLVLMSFILISFEGYIINSLNDKSLFFTLILPVLIGNLWLLGLIFSIIGLRINPKGRAIAGLIISLLPIILFLFTAIIVSPQISTPIHFENELKERKTQAIERIKDVRTAQRAFRAEYQRYAENFDELERFLYTNPTELRCDIEQLRYIPNSDNEFIMETGFTKTSSNRTGPFIEVRAPYKLFLDTIKYRQEIINLIDEEVNVFDRYPGIKFGAMEEA
ncbi:hypothetical protein, partial [Alistipes onderdonkii]|uniref:hypothetical protein n=1 Tax=Alistipes onderdonkii TaxID=328813 RepID=UPI0032ED8AD6